MLTSPHSDTTMKTDPPRQLHLNVNILHPALSPSAWRTRDATIRALSSMSLTTFASRRSPKAAKFDAVFLADNASIADQIDFLPDHRTRADRAVSPPLLRRPRISALSARRRRGYNEPYNIARRFATLDQLSAKAAPAGTS